MNYLCGLGVGLLVLVAGISAGESDLPVFAFYDIGQGYTVGDTAVDYDTAKLLCDAAGKALVSIESAEEDKLIMSLLRNSNVPPQSWLWGSGTNLASERRLWQWGNRSPLFHSRWFTGQPDSYAQTEPRCLAIANDIGDRAWYPNTCTVKHLPLCENK